MPFSQMSLQRVNAPVLRGNEVYLSWTAENGSGAWYQLYLNQKLAWYGQRPSVWLPVPAGPLRVDIGSVNAGEQLTDFSSLLTQTSQRRCQLQWQAGRVLSQSIIGFRVYGSNSPGVTMDLSVPLADITAYPAGLQTDGFGLGAFSSGGFGYVSGTYSWTSSPLSSGVWTFGVVPYDSYGNQGLVESTTITILAPPRAPAAGSDGTRLRRCLRGFSSSGYGNSGFGSTDAVLWWNSSLM
jgi:hypothetical protein